jgi:methionyl-tRNA synthetase
MKIQKAAEEAGEACDQFCDRVSQSFRSLSDHFDISYSTFVRTSSTRHADNVARVWEQLDRKEHIYKDTYTGWYSVSDETFVPDLQTEEVNRFLESLDKIIRNEVEIAVDSSLSESDQEQLRQERRQSSQMLSNHVKRQLTKLSSSETNDVRMVDTESGNLLEHCSEENYMFKMSAFQERLLSHLDENADFIMPNYFQKFVTNQLQENALRDISISRSKTRFHWGIPVPNDDSQIVSVRLPSFRPF